MSSVRADRRGRGTAHVGTPRRGSSHTCSTVHTARMTTKPTQVSITAPFPFEPRPLSADLARTSSKNTAARPGPLLCHGRARRSPKDSTDRRLELLSVEESSASAEFSALNRLTDVVGNDLGHLGSAAFLRTMVDVEPRHGCLNGTVLRALRSR